MKMEAAWSSKMLVPYHITIHHNPEDWYLKKVINQSKQDIRQNLKVERWQS